MIQSLVFLFCFFVTIKALIVFTNFLTGSTHTITPIKYLKHLQHPDFLDPNAAPEDQLPAEDKWRDKKQGQTFLSLHSTLLIM